MSTAPMEKTTLPQGAPLSDPFARCSSLAMIALRSAARFTATASSAAQTPGLGSAGPLSQRSTVRAGRRADGEGPRATGKIRPAAARREDPEKFRSRHGGLIGAASTTLVSHMDLLTRFSRIHDRSISSTDRMPRLHQMTENGSADLIAGRFPPVPSGKWAYPVESSAVYLPKLGLA